MTARTAIGLLSFFALAACAAPRSDDWPTGFTGGEAGKLQATRQACATEVGAVDMNDPARYSDPRYGAAAAMAQAVDSNAYRGGARKAAFDAMFTDCMARAGWKKGA